MRRNNFRTGVKFYTVARVIYMVHRNQFQALNSNQDPDEMLMLNFDVARFYRDWDQNNEEKEQFLFNFIIFCDVAVNETQVNDVNV